MHKKQETSSRARRHTRVRAKISGTAERPRLSVFRSLQHTSAQLIDDLRGATVAAAHTHTAGARAKRSTPLEAAFRVGEELARKALAQKITHAVFDRGGYVYHGRVRAVAEGARNGGLQV